MITFLIASIKIIEWKICNCDKKEKFWTWKKVQGEFDIPYYLKIYSNGGKWLYINAYIYKYYKKNKGNIVVTKSQLSKIVVIQLMSLIWALRFLSSNNCTEINIKANQCILRNIYLSISSFYD